MIESICSLAVRVTKIELGKRGLPASYLDPDDVGQDALMVLFVRHTAIRDVRKLRSWLWTVMRIRLGERLRGAKLAQPLSDLDKGEVLHVRAEVDAGAVPENPRRHAVLLALARLSPKLRRVVELKIYHGHSHEETARALAIRPATVRVRWLRAKRALQESLGRLLEPSS